MSTDTSTTNPPADGGTSTTGGTPTGGGGFEPITSQDELNRIIGERVTRERAKFADYPDLKAKAGRVDEVEGKLAEYEGKLSEVPAQVASTLRTHLISLHGISTDDADLLLTATDPDKLLKQVNALVARTGGQQAGPHVSHEGQTTTAAPPDPRRAFLRDLMGDAATT